MNRWKVSGLLASLLLIPGCGTMSLMTRSSYSTIRDPFIEGTEGAAAAGLSADSGGDTAGRVVVDADSRGPTALPGVSGRVRLEGDSALGGEPVPAAATASYPDSSDAAASGAADSGAGESVLQTMKGPALATFLRTGATPAGERMTPEIGEAGAGVRSRTGGVIERTGLELPQRAVGGLQSPAAQAAAMTSDSAEFEGFNSFLAGDSAATSAEVPAKRAAEWKTATVPTSAVDAASRSERMKTLQTEGSGEASELNPFEDLPSFDTVGGSAQQQGEPATFDDSFGSEADWKPAEFEP
jgi:hypothetical protein